MEAKHRVLTEMPLELALWLQDTATKEDRSVSELVREAIRDYRKNKETKGE